MLLPSQVFDIYTYVYMIIEKCVPKYHIRETLQVTRWTWILFELETEKEKEKRGKSLPSDVITYW